MSGLGAGFRKAREARGISIDGVAGETRIAAKFLRAIENEEFEVLPGGIFNRGFIRSYAERLGLDPDQAVEDYERLVQERASDEPEPPLNERPVRPVRKGMPGWAPAAGIAALIIAAGIYAFFPRKDALPKTTPLPAADIAPRVTPALSQTPEPIRVEEPIQPQPAQTQPEPEPRPADPPPPARAPLTVDIRVTAASWIQIYTDGTPTEAGVLEPGATRHYSAQKTINMVVGNAGGLSLTVNDREISPLGKSGEVRQFTITPENAAQLKSSAPGN